MPHLREIAIENFDLTGTNPDSWELVREIQDGGLREPLPTPLQKCADCGRDFMRQYQQCPMCDSPNMRPFQEPGPARG